MSKEKIVEILDKIKQNSKYLNDSKDISYILSKKILELRGYRLTGNKLFDSKGNEIAEYKDSNYNEDDLSIKLKFYDPSYITVVNISLNDIKEVNK